MKYFVILATFTIALVIFEAPRVYSNQDALDVILVSSNNSSLKNDTKTARQARFWTFGELFGFCAGRYKMCGASRDGKECCGDLACLLSPENGGWYCVFDQSIIGSQGYLDGYGTGMTGYGY